MSTVVISANPASFDGPFVTINLSLVAQPLYRKEIEANKLPQIEAAVMEARAALAGQNAAIWVRVKQGRKPNGFDAWWDSRKRELQYVQAVQS
jgi:hypothetical protein